MSFSYIVDQFHDKYSLTNTSTSKETLKTNKEKRFAHQHTVALTVDKHITIQECSKYSLLGRLQPMSAYKTSNNDCVLNTVIFKKDEITATQITQTGYSTKTSLDQQGIF